MVGVGAGTLVLIGSVVFIIVCWGLRKNKKSVRNLLEKDNQELTAPLSLSNNRNGLGEPLSFNFQQSADTTFINIINKYAVSTSIFYILL